MLIRATAATDRLYVAEIGFSLNAGTASSVGLIRSLTLGTSSSTAAGQAQDPGDAAAVGTVDYAWSAAPTIAGSPVYMRRCVCPATAGYTVIWVFPKPIVVTNAATGGLLLWNFGASTASILSAYACWEE
jgi:hypothetical protein